MRYLAPLLVLCVLLAGCGEATPTASLTPPTATPSVSPVGPHAIWHPAPGLSWQWQLSGDVDSSVKADVYDIDLWATSSKNSVATLVADLHAHGRKVICYVDAGSYESWRPDHADFPASVLGKQYVGYHEERWLDIRQLGILGPILAKRLDLCAAAGFDGVEPDNVDGFQNDTGFPLTADNQLSFNTWLATQAHQRGLSVGLKNDPDQVTTLEPLFDWALVEDCFAQGWCAKLAPFTHDHKAVFAAEYTGTNSDFTGACASAKTASISVILKHPELDAWRQTCA
jgi:hypothetical protein